MSKSTIGFLVAFALVYITSAQSLETFNKERLDINKKGMLVLSSWALANLISSPILASRTTGSTRYFHQMNGYWNTVNLAIAGLGYYSAVTGDSSGLSLAESVREQHSIEKILLLNTGLDAAYVTTGLFLRERGMRKESDRLKGFGNSLVLQGGFLFAFDIVLYLVHHQHAEGLYNLLSNVTVTLNGVGMVLNF